MSNGFHSFQLIQSKLRNFPEHSIRKWKQKCVSQIYVFFDNIVAFNDICKVNTWFNGTGYAV